MRPPRLEQPSSRLIVDARPRQVFVPLSKDPAAQFAPLIDSAAGRS
jgi:hypothetical protein